MHGVTFHFIAIEIFCMSRGRNDENNYLFYNGAIKLNFLQVFLLFRICCVFSQVKRCCIACSLEEICCFTGFSSFCKYYLNYWHDLSKGRRVYTLSWKTAEKMFRPASGCAQHPKAGRNTQQYTLIKMM